MGNNQAVLFSGLMSVMKTFITSVMKTEKAYYENT